MRITFSRPTSQVARCVRWRLYSVYGIRILKPGWGSTALHLQRRGRRCGGHTARASETLWGVNIKLLKESAEISSNLLSRSHEVLTHSWYSTCYFFRSIPIDWVFVLLCLSLISKSKCCNIGMRNLFYVPCWAIVVQTLHAETSGMHFLFTGKSATWVT